MPDSPDIIPIDDRAWPRSSVLISVVMVLAAVGTCTGLTVSTVGSGPGAVLAIVIGFVSAFGFEFAALGAAFRLRFAGRAIPGRFRLVIMVPLLVAFVVVPTASAAVGGAVLAGAIGGLMASNLWAKRAARAYRDIVEAAEAADAPEAAEAALASDQDVPSEGTRPAYGAATTPSASVGQLLHEAVAHDRRRWLAWLVAGAHRTTGQIAVIWLATFPVGLLHLAHCIASSGYILVAVLAGHVSAPTYVWWLGVATAGNIVGGTGIVTLLNYGQVRAGTRQPISQ